LRGDLKLKIKNRDWFRRKLEAVKAIGYIFGYSVKSVERSFGQRKSDILKLDSNENFFIPKYELVKLIMEVIEEFDPRLYPQEEEQELREKISSYIRIPADRIVVGN
jgi:histidinol-phosphate/aromatic aminotransferase/cobyric acid decarboxylase-like protein